MQGWRLYREIAERRHRQWSVLPAVIGCASISAAHQK
jgi:hypothetical protein